MEQPVQQQRACRCRQLVRLEGVEQCADSGPAVIVSFVAGQLLQHETAGALAVGAEQQTAWQLFGLAEIVLEDPIQAGGGQFDLRLW